METPESSGESPEYDEKSLEYSRESPVYKEISPECHEKPLESGELFPKKSMHPNHRVHAQIFIDYLILPYASIQMRVSLDSQLLLHVLLQLLPLVLSKQSVH